ncbi:MAG: class I SAM-dependent methyltransferase, partial [Caldisericia bacterium]|nr:class I SAM-dependent methyltransferase [Caldisericia bacterium]
MIEKNEYTGFFAEFYDRLHESDDDINAYIQFGKKYGHRILELGSGTGRILIPLAKAGCIVTGLEFSQDMINIAVQKLNKESLPTIERCTILNGDATNFLLDQVFDLIIAPCNFINHFPTFEQLELMFSCVKKHMTASTVLVVDNSVPSLQAWIETNGKEEVFEFDGPDRDKKIIDRFTASF